MRFVGSMTWLDFACLCLAVGAAIDAWRNGSIFASWRASVETRADQFDLGQRRYFWAKLLDCTFCVSYHVPYITGIVAYLPSLLWPDFSILLKSPLYCLAATRVSWILNGLVPDHLRYGYRTNKERDTDQEEDRDG